jgi:acyl-CoA dehydrogenase
MTGFSTFLVIIATLGILTYHRVKLVIATAIYAAVLIVLSRINGVSVGIVFYWLTFLAVAIPLNYLPLRRRLISARAFDIFRRQMPPMSNTEREAISAGTITWEADLFRGNPDWKKLLALPEATLTAEEQAFIEGPVNTVCGMVCDWEVTHTLADLSPEVWAYLKSEGFFGLIIPKQYGGKGFSAFAHSQVIVKLSGRCVTLSTTVSVPNSLGPAELLLEYGTEEQKNYYLPRLASGQEVPCFALTSPEAGSDAGAMTDHGVVCWGELNGQRTLGIKLNWNKRYITLAPVATVIGLAFKLYDPDHLIGQETEIGITCALIPRNTPGITIGRRHFPLNSTFQNGPTQGVDVFISLDWIIGGQAQAGHGWHMLMESLAGGRAITLPSSTVGGAKGIVYATGAYARIRRQFHLPIGYFEGIEEPLARIAGYSYIMDAARVFVSGSLNQGEKPSVASAIVKYHVTEMGRLVTNDAMDIHGGKGICLGPNNYLGRGYESSPIAITVEGANILTRNLIIFGQGAMRCHPYIYKEIQAAQMPDTKAGLLAFDRVLMKHLGFSFSNVVRAFVLGLSSAYIVSAPSGKLKHYFQSCTRFSSAFALLADASMMLLGGNLKRKENISARLGDILSYLYLNSAVLKHYNDQGRPIEDLPIVRYALELNLFIIQERFDEILRNFPNRPAAWVLRALIFPLGMRFSKPRDKYNHKIAQLLLSPTATRQRLSAGAYLAPTENNAMVDLQDALIKCIQAEPIEKLLREASQTNKLSGYTFKERAQSALDNKIINIEQFDILMQADVARSKVIAVDDFASDELAHHSPLKEANRKNYAQQSESR